MKSQANALMNAQRGQGLLWASVAFMVGIAFYFSLYREPDMAYGFAAFSIALIVYRVFRRKRYDEAAYIQGLRALMIGVLAFIFGFVITQAQIQYRPTPMLLKDTGPLIVEGRVEQLERQSPSQNRVVLSDLALEGFAAHETPHKIRLSTYHMAVSKDQVSESKPLIKPGDTVSFLAQLRAPSRPVLPGGYDFQRSAFFQDIGAVGFTLGQMQIIEGDQETGSIRDKIKSQIEIIRLQVNARVEKVQSFEQSSVSTALMTGMRKAIDDQTLEDIRAAGLAHLLAISGLHIGLVCGFVFFLLRFLLLIIPRLVLYYPIKKYAAFGALLAGLCYMLIAGSTIPTQRAMLMSGIVLLAIMLDRQAISMRLVAIAIWCVLLLNPSNILSPSFQLSFAAVAALITFYQSIRKANQSIYENVEDYTASGVPQSRIHHIDGVSVDEDGVVLSPKDLKKLQTQGDRTAPLFSAHLFKSRILYPLLQMKKHSGGRFMLYFMGIIMTTLIATFATSLFSIFHFGKFNPYGILGNMLALPLVTFWVMPLAVLSMILWPVPFLSDMCLKLMGVGVSYLLDIAHWVASLPGSVWLIPQMPDGSFLLFIAAFICVCLWQGAGRFSTCFVLCVAALICWAFVPRSVAIIHADPVSVSYIKDHRTPVVHHFPKALPSFINRQVDEYFGLSPSYDFEAEPFQSQDLQCDLSGCGFSLSENTQLFFSDSPISYQENCQVARRLTRSSSDDWFILLSARPIERAKRCEGKNIRSIAFFDLWRNGAYKVTQTLWTGAVSLHSVEKERGYRPWTTKQMRWDKRRQKKEDE